MKTKHFFKMSSLLISVILASCSGDETTAIGQQGQNLNTSGMTEFSVVENNVGSVITPQTRTSGEYTGSSVKFYWTSNDQLWINNTAVTPALKPSSQSTIPATGGKETTAKFWFEGTYTASTYPVRYTGNGNSTGDKVTIKSAQAQQTPNDGAHIGTDGDCGTAIANRLADGSYQFTLDHKASYLTFVPYYSFGFTTDVKITQIKVTADQTIAGIYGFDDSGISTASPTSPSTSITLTLNGGGTNGFEIPSTQDYAKNAAIMVIAPGSYTNFTVEYTLYDQVTQVIGTVSKNYGNITCTAGKNRKVAADLAVINRGDKLYMWDAQQDYWYGYESEQPILNGQTGPHYPKSKISDPTRWHNDIYAPAGSSITATGRATVCPNVNEMMWYVFKGDPHWDKDKLFSFAKHLYKGGMWFKKKSIIMSENGLTDATMKAKYNGMDYRPISTGWSRRNETIITGAPSNTSTYFFLPAINFFYNGSFYPSNQNGLYGDYWTSSASARNDNTTAFNLAFTPTVAGIYSSNRPKGAMTIAFE